MAKSLHARLVAYRPFGERIGVLAEPVSFSASMLHDDDGAISIEYSLLSGDAQAFDRELTDGLEVAVEVSDGSGYREPDNARFVITGRSGKTDDQTKTITYSGQSIGWLLSKAENNDSSHLLADGDNKGKRPFHSANPGMIIKTMLDENRQRGGVAIGLTLGFDTAKDAAGAAWSKKYTLYYSLGTDLQTILSSLVNGGGCDWRTTGRTLKMWNADSAALSRDLSKSVILRLARDIGEAPFEESIADLASTILVEGDNNLLFRMDNPAAPTPWGKWESYSSQGGVSDKGTAQAFMQSTLNNAARVRGQYTRNLIISDVDSLPLVDYHAGDWITAPTITHGEKVRVQEIDLSMRQGEGLTASLALNDIRYDAAVRQAKKIKGITGGAALAGSESGKATTTDRDHRVPKAPQGLVVQTAAYLDADGHARGLATVSWAEVTQATNGQSIEISGYRAEWRRNVDGAPWNSAGTTDATRLGFGDLDCGTKIEVRVRAIPKYSDQLGEWSGVLVVMVESDTMPCSIPSTPVATSELGVVTVHWNGLTSVGSAMESDFARIELAEGRGDDAQVIDASLTGQGDIVLTGLAVGSEHTYMLRSVDRSGNRSGWSKSATVIVASAVSAAEMEQLRKDLAANDVELEKARKDIDANAKTNADTADKVASVKSDVDKAKTDIIAAATKADKAQTTADGKSRIYRGPDEPAHDGLKPGDMWWRTQKCWTRWQGEENDSPSVLGDFYTYWQGEENDSPSVLVPLTDRVVEVLTWNGTRFERFDLVASNVLATGTVSAGSLAAGSVTASKIAAAAITADKIAALSIHARHIVSKAITADKIAANAVTSGKLAAGSVTASKIAAAAITADKIAAKTITSDRIAAGQFKGYVFTGSVFQSSESADTGMRLDGTALRMWDAKHARTVYLDGEGASNLITGRLKTGSSGAYLDLDPAFRLSSATGFSSQGSGIRFVGDGFTGSSNYPFVSSELVTGGGKQISGLTASSGLRVTGRPNATLSLLQDESQSGIAQLAAYHDITDSKAAKAMVYLAESAGGTGTARLQSGAAALEFSGTAAKLNATGLTVNQKTAQTERINLIIGIKQSGNTVTWTTASFDTELGLIVTAPSGAKQQSMTFMTSDQYQALAGRIDKLDDTVGISTTPSELSIDWAGHIQSEATQAGGKWTDTYRFQSLSADDAFLQIRSASGKFKVHVTAKVNAGHGVAASNIGIEFTESASHTGGHGAFAGAGSTGPILQVSSGSPDGSGGTVNTSTSVGDNPRTVTLKPNVTYYANVSIATYSPGSKGAYNDLDLKITIDPA